MFRKEVIIVPADPLTKNERTGAPLLASVGHDHWLTSERVVGGGSAPREPRRIASVVALSGLAVALVAATSEGLLSHLRGGVPGVSIEAVLGDVVAVLLAVTLLGFVVLGYLAWVVRAPRRREPESALLEEEEPQRVLDWSALLLPLLFTSVVCLAIVIGWLFGEPDGTDTTGRLPSPRGRPPSQAPSGGGPESWLVHWLVFAVLSSVGAAVAAVFLVRDRRARRRAARLTAAEELVVAVEESLDDLEGEADPRLAVIRAYGRMERALALHGAARRPPETPLEYLARALASVRSSRASITRLTALFQRAKFSRHTVDAAMKGEAIDALRNLRTELADSEVVGAVR